MAPTIYREGPYRFHFFSEEGREPAHVHVQAAGSRAKVWLHDGSVARCQGFQDHEIAQILRNVEIHRADFQEAWNDYFAES